MDYEKFHQAVVLAYINHDGDPKRFLDEVVSALNQFREEKQAAQHRVQRTGLCPECGAPGYDKIVCEQCGFTSPAANANRWKAKACSLCTTAIAANT